MKHLCLIITAIFISFNCYAQAPGFQWAQAIGGTGNCESYSIAIDDFGNVYTTGVFSGLVDFDPGVGVYNLNSFEDSDDIFISKLDSSGNFVWAKAIGGTSSDDGNSITLDATGNIYIAGFFNDTVDFNTSAGVFNLSTNGYSSGFILKLNDVGDFVWAKAISGETTSTIHITSIFIDPLENILTTGYFGTYGALVDFDPGLGVFNLAANGNHDIFISKLNSAGDFVWAKVMGGAGDYDEGYSIVTDFNGNVYSTGRFKGTADFNPEAATFNLISGGTSGAIYISKLDVSGNFVWATSIDSANGYSLAVSPLGNIYATGKYYGSYANVWDIFTAKFDALGNYVWSKTMGGSNYDFGLSICLDALENVYTTGYYTGTVDFDPGVGVYNMGPSGTSPHTFISKLDASGNFVWAKSFGGLSHNYGYSITLDASANNIYTSGSFEGTTDFNPDGGTFNLVSTGNSSIYISKLGPVPIINLTGSLTFGNVLIGQTAQLSYTINNSGGADLTVSSIVYPTGFTGNWSSGIIPAGGSQVVIVTFSPINAIPYNGTITVNSNANSGTNTITCSGTGVNATRIINLSGNLSFGSIPIGSFGQTTLTISNTGTGALTISSINYPSGFSGNWSNGIIAAGSTQNITVTFSPLSNVTYGGTITINSNATSGINTINCSGIGVNPTISILAPKIILSSGSINAGQNIAVTGLDFTHSGSVDVSVTGPGNYIFTITITATSTGGFILPFVTNTGMLPGTYNVVATDASSDLSTVIKVFTLINTGIAGEQLNIINPVEGDVFNSGQNIALTWLDLLQTGNTYPMNGVKRVYQYDIEYSTNGGSSWNYYSTITGEDYPTTTINKTIYFTTNVTGSYLLKVKDYYQSSNYGISGAFSVVPTATNNIRIEKKWDFSYANQNNTLEGIAADGTARFYLAISKIDQNSGSAINNVSVSLSDNVSSTTTALGKVMNATQITGYSSEANNASSISSINYNSISNKFWFWYVAPDDFTRTNQGDQSSSFRNVTANITVTYANGSSEVLHEQIKVVRPPLMLVHGLGAAPSTWDDFSNNTLLGDNVKFLHDPRFMSAHAVKLYPHQSFLVNALELVNSDNFSYPSPYYASFQDVVRDMRSKGYAANKVDYVGHSMGGVILRTAIETYNTYYTRTGTQSNLDFKNYESGYINKLITISSPHNSSPLADIIDRYIGDLSYINRSLLEGYYHINPNALPFSFIQPDYNGGLLNVPNFQATPAVKNLKLDENNGGVNFGSTNTPTHLIAGDVFPGTQSFNNYAIPQSVILSYEEVVDQLDFLDKLLKITVANEQDQQLVSDLLEATDIDNPVHRAFKYVEIMAQVFNLLVFIPESDLVVAVESQLADYPKTATNVSVFDDNITHCCFGKNVLNQIETGNKVIEMLNSPISSTSFLSIPATSNKMAPEFFSAPLIPALISSSIDTSQLDLISPLNASTVYIDSSITISVDLKDTVSLVSVDVNFQGKSYRLEKQEATIMLDVQVSPFALDTQLIYVEAFYKYPDSSRFTYDTVKVFVTTLSQLHQIKVEPEILFLLKQETQFPTYHAIYDEFTTTVQSFSPHINAVIADNSIVEFDQQTKGFKGIADGETWATISYEGFIDTIYLVVRREVEPDSGVITMIDELQIAREEASPTIIVYPNPANGRISIKAEKADDYAVALFNNTGQILTTGKFTGNNHSMNISGLPVGLYILGITDKTDRRQMFKVVKE